MGHYLKIKDGGTDSEADRLSRRFRSLHERLLREMTARKKLEGFKNDLTNMLVHDMKHPLTVLNAVLAMLADGGGKELTQGKRQSLLNMTKRNIRRENAMIEDLLQLARLNNTEMPLRKKRLSLKFFIEECAREGAAIAGQFQRGWHLEIGEDVQSSWIFGDRALLKRLVGNLVLNAFEHAPPETGVTLGARLCGKDRSRAEICVRDAGPGIPPEQREAIFKQFGTFAESTHNVGLGLAFCKLVAEKHSARLELLDSGEPGTTFALVIPVAEEPAAENGAKSAGSGAPLPAQG